MCSSNFLSSYNTDSNIGLHVEIRSIWIITTMACHGVCLQVICVSVIGLLLYDELLFTNKAVLVVLFVVRP